MEQFTEFLNQFLIAHTNERSDCVGWTEGNFPLAQLDMVLETVVAKGAAALPFLVEQRMVEVAIDALQEALEAGDEGMASHISPFLTSLLSHPTADFWSLAHASSLRQLLKSALVPTCPNPAMLINVLVGIATCRPEMPVQIADAFLEVGCVTKLLESLQNPSLPIHTVRQILCLLVTILKASDSGASSLYSQFKDGCGYKILSRLLGGLASSGNLRREDTALLRQNVATVAELFHVQAGIETGSGGGALLANESDTASEELFTQVNLDAVILFSNSFVLATEAGSDGNTRELWTALLSQLFAELDSLIRSSTVACIQSILSQGVVLRLLEQVHHLTPQLQQDLLRCVTCMTLPERNIQPFAELCKIASVLLHPLEPVEESVLTALREMVVTMVVANEQEAQFQWAQAGLVNSLMELVKRFHQNEKEQAATADAHEHCPPQVRWHHRSQSSMMNSPTPHNRQRSALDPLPPSAVGIAVDTLIWLCRNNAQNLQVACDYGAISPLILPLPSPNEIEPPTTRERLKLWRFMVLEIAEETNNSASSPTGENMMDLVVQSFCDLFVAADWLIFKAHRELERLKFLGQGQSVAVIAPAMEMLGMVGMIVEEVNAVLQQNKLFEVTAELEKMLSRWATGNGTSADQMKRALSFDVVEQRTPYKGGCPNDQTNKMPSTISDAFIAANGPSALGQILRSLSKIPQIGVDVVFMEEPPSISSARQRRKSRRTSPLNEIEVKTNLSLQSSLIPGLHSSLPTHLKSSLTRVGKASTRAFAAALTHKTLHGSYPVQEITATYANFFRGLNSLIVSIHEWKQHQLNVLEQDSENRTVPQLAWDTLFILSLLSTLTPETTKLRRAGDPHLEVVQQILDGSQSILCPQALLMGLELIACWSLMKQAEPLLPELTLMLEAFSKGLMINVNGKTHDAERFLQAGAVGSILSLLCSPLCGETEWEEAFLEILGNLARIQLTTPEVRSWITSIISVLNQTQSLAQNSDAFPLGDRPQGHFSTPMIFGEKVYGRAVKLLHVLAKVAQGDILCDEEQFRSAAWCAFETGPSQSDSALVHVVGLTSQSAATSMSWPPSHGFTVSLWFNIEQASDGQPLTLFQMRFTNRETVLKLQVVDWKIVFRVSDETCFVSRNLDFRLSAKWAHLVMTSAPSKMFGSKKDSTVSIFVDGEYIDSFKLLYPSQAMQSSTLFGTMGVIHCDIGTEISENTLPKSNTKWQVGPMYFLSTILDTVAIRMLFGAGPLYSGFFHGEDASGSIPLVPDFCSASFLMEVQRFASSFVRSPERSKGDDRKGKNELEVEEESGLEGNMSEDLDNDFRAMNLAPAGPAGLVQNNLLFVLHKGARMTRNNNNYMAGGQAGLLQIHKQGNCEFLHASRLADSLVGVSQFLPAVLLLLLHVCQTEEDVENAISIFVSSITCQHQNLSQMEKANAYAPAAHLIKKKAEEGLVSLTAYRLLLSTVGPWRSLMGQSPSFLIANPFSLHHFVLCPDVWASCAPEVHHLCMLTVSRAMETSDLSMRELNLERLRQANIPRHLLYMVLDSSLSEEVLTTTCSVIRQFYTQAPYLGELQMILHLILSTLSKQFGKGVGEDMLNHWAQSKEEEPLYKGSQSLEVPERISRDESLGWKQRISRNRRLFIRHLLLKLILDLIQNFKGNADQVMEDEELPLIFKAIPCQTFIYLVYHFSDITDPYVKGLQSKHLHPSQPSKSAIRRDPVAGLLSLEAFLEGLPYQMAFWRLNGKLEGGFRCLNYCLPHLYTSLLLSWPPSTGDSPSRSKRLIELLMVALLGSRHLFELLQQPDMDESLKIDEYPEFLALPEALPLLLSVLQTSAFLSNHKRAEQAKTRLDDQSMSKTARRRHSITALATAQAEVAKSSTLFALDLLDKLFKISQKFQELWLDFSMIGKDTKPGSSEDLVYSVVQIMYAGIFTSFPLGDVDTPCDAISDASEQDQASLEFFLKECEIKQVQELEEDYLDEDGERLNEENLPHHFKGRHSVGGYVPRRPRTGSLDMTPQKQKQSNRFSTKTLGKFESLHVPRSSTPTIVERGKKYLRRVVSASANNNADARKSKHSYELSPDEYMMIQEHSPRFSENEIPHAAMNLLLAIALKDCLRSKGNTACDLMLKSGVSLKYTSDSRRLVTSVQHHFRVTFVDTFLQGVLEETEIWFRGSGSKKALPLNQFCTLALEMAMLNYHISGMGKPGKKTLDGSSGLAFDSTDSSEMESLADNIGFRALNFLISIVQLGQSSTSSRGKGKFGDLFGGFKTKMLRGSSDELEWMTGALQTLHHLIMLLMLKESSNDTVFLQILLILFNNFDITFNSKVDTTQEVVSECFHVLYFHMCNDNRKISHKSMEILRDLLRTPHVKFLQSLLTFKIDEVTVDLFHDNDGGSGGFYLLGQDENIAHEMSSISPLQTFQLWLGSLEDSKRQVFENVFKKEIERRGKDHRIRIHRFAVDIHKQWESSIARRTQIDIKSRKIVSRWLVPLGRLVRTTQRTELERQVKMLQQALDHAKFGQRRWAEMVTELYEEGVVLFVSLDKIRLPGNFCITSGNSILEDDEGGLLQGDWTLDFTEGPSRMRRKVLRSGAKLVSTSEDQTVVQESGGHEMTLVQVNKQAAQVIPRPRIGTKEYGSDSSTAPMSKSSDMSSEGFLTETDSDVESISDSEHGFEVTLEEISSPLSQSAKMALERKHSAPSDCESSQNRSLSRQSSFEENFDEEEEEDTEDIADVDEKLKPLLLPEDEVKLGYNCSCVFGMDTTPGLLLFGKKNFYIVENFMSISMGKSRITPKSRKQNFFNMSHIIEIDGTEEDLLDSFPARFAITPKRVSKTIKQDISHKCLHWSYDEVEGIHRMRFLLRPTAVEFFVSNGERFLITFRNSDEMSQVYQELLMSCQLTDAEHAGGRPRPLASFSRGGVLSDLTDKWVSGQLSNFDYLMHLNTLAGRSYNDLTQYPVFPWVLRDYVSDNLDLTDPSVFRDFSKPMGVQHPEREVEFRRRFEELEEEHKQEPSNTPPPFHYGTHYSTAGIILHYLIRLQPFAELHTRLQGSKFDQADRLFFSVKQTWLSSSGSYGQENTQDVKELIPEFFYLPELFENRNRYAFGWTEDGVKVDDVILPPWAKGSSSEFVRLHRKALESDYVSHRLHEWIDLIFGYKQIGKPAKEACNTYFYLTYEGALDLDKIKDPKEYEAYVTQIHEYGQTPSQLFQKPHPARSKITMSRSNTWWQRLTNSGNSTEPLKRTLCKLQFKINSVSGILKELQGCMIAPPPSQRQAVGAIWASQKMLGLRQVRAVGQGSILLPNSNMGAAEGSHVPETCLVFGLVGAALRLCQLGQSEGAIGAGKILATWDLFEGCINRATVTSDGRTLLTAALGSCIIQKWKLQPFQAKGNEKINKADILQHETTLVTLFHEGEIECLAVSQEYSLAVSICSVAKNAVIWDLNRNKCTRRLLSRPLPSSKCTIELDGLNGLIVIGCLSQVYCFDVNGTLEAHFNTGLSSITSLCLSFGFVWEDMNIILCGHSSGQISVWSFGESVLNTEESSQQFSFAPDECGEDCQQPSMRFEQYINKKIKISKLGPLKYEACERSAVTALHISMDHSQVYSGHENGDVFQWKGWK